MIWKNIKKRTKEYTTGNQKSKANNLKKNKNKYIIKALKTKETEKEKKNMATREKNIWILLIFILSGLVIGGLLGELAGRVDFLWWLGYGQDFGLSNPVQLDLSIVQISFGLLFKINIASIIGMIIAILVYRKI